ncbi:hypothetical protein INT45_011662 [Circinella minor]|uniref:Yeast cell wall synthesis Kre9/Knh1-like N-terminal domain-containing protein n=1 Tax=Circinella minor TaxID=1195481 RepID=A0A8H7VCY7_9FUNG|nr:hypothetical protein INT45_011662 [Circinella minor]
MVFKSFITTSAVVMAFVSGIAATMAPNYPQPGTVWTAGKEYQITWADDGEGAKLPEGWTNFNIEFMTGDNLNMIPLTSVATGVDASKGSTYTWTAPQVEPYSAVYFLQFTNDKGEKAWTTRFAIVAQDGQTPAPEPEKTQPNGGENIPWGVGKLADGAAPAASSPAVSPPAADPSSSPAVSSPATPESSSAVAPAASSTESSNDQNSSSDADAAAADSSDSKSAKVEKDDADSAAGSIHASIGAMVVGLVATGYALA